MDKPTALIAVKAIDVEERLTAARYLSVHAEREDLPFLLSALASEKIGWVSRALARAIDRANATVRQEAQAEFEDEGEEPQNNGRARAVEEVTGTILHEITPVVGLVRLYASSEMGSLYQKSKTKSALDHLNSLMDCIRELKAVASQPKMAECDLSSLVSRAVSSLEEDHQLCVSIANHDPFLIVIDEAHMFIAIVNGLRNAAEAAIAHNGENGTSKPGVIVNWGRAGQEDWLAVIDNGPGFHQTPESMIRMGATLKKGSHLGFGLTLVQQAITAMEGTLSLSNSPSGGAIFELRWLRK